MSVYIVCNGTTYSDLKPVSFAPEDDPTLNTLSICEFSAEIVTTDAAQTFKGQTAALFENRFGTDVLLAGGYTVKEAEQIAPGVVRVLAKSLLAYLDGRVLPAKLYNPSVSIDVFFEDLFIGTAEEDAEEIIIWDDDDPPIRRLSGPTTCSGFFPRQTARERLQMYCQARSCRVLQWGESSASGLAVCDNRYSSFTNTAYILPEETFRQPIVKRASEIGILRVTGYSNHTDAPYGQADDWIKYTITEGWSDPDTGLSKNEEAIYYKSYPHEYLSGDGAKGIMEIKDNLHMITIPYVGTLELACFSRYEVELDALCFLSPTTSTPTARTFFPGDKVAFSVKDDQQIYCGVIKSAQYTFGKLTRVKLRIITDMAPTATATVICKYRYLKNGSYVDFARKTYILPARGNAWVSMPEYMMAYDGDTLIRLQNTGDHTRFVTANEAGTIYIYTTTYTVI